jgi:hypothetical protein
LCEVSTPFLNLRWLFKCAPPPSRNDGARVRRARAWAFFCPRRMHALRSPHAAFARAHFSRFRLRRAALPRRRALQKRSPRTLTRAAAALGCASHARLSYRLDLLFAATFLGARVAGYGAGLAHTLHAAARGYMAPVAPAARVCMLSLISAGFVLNLMWARRLMRGLRRSRARAEQEDAGAGAGAAAGAAGAGGGAAQNGKAE